MYKIAFFDVDGTLLKFKTENMSPKVAYALNNIQERGVKLCMMSGRSNAIVPRFENVNFDLVATFNGSYIRQGDEVISTTPMKKSDIIRIIKNLEDMDRAYTLCNKDIFITSGHDAALEEYFSFGSARPNVVNNIEDYYDDDIFQMMCACTKEEYPAVLKGTERTMIEAWWDRAVDIIPSNSGKGVAVNTVLKYLGINKEQAIAFGDGDNDVAMFKEVGTAVAMGNAKEKVKACSDIICKPVEEDGVYDYLSNQFKFTYTE